MSKLTTRTSERSTFSQKINDYKMLVKFRLNMTVVFSAVMAFLIASSNLSSFLSKIKLPMNL